MKAKRLLFFLNLLLSVTTLFAQPGKLRSKHIHAAPDTLNLRSDTINILHYTINLNVTDFTHDTLRGNTVIQFTPKMNNIKSLSLDLLHFTVDSIVLSAQHLNYAYNDTLLIAVLPSIMNIGDTNNVNVYYHGKPVIDASGFGGFYFQKPYAYNLGAAFINIPHAMGRAWYPCFDNFVTRATYTFNIITDSANRAYCNGYLIKDTIMGALRTTTWSMPHTITSYQAGVDVAPYAEMDETYYGMDTLPIVIAALPADTANTRKSFVHLTNAITIFQTCWGRYRWNRVGYAMTSFTGGAMEHPTNIAYPQVFANGTTTYEAELMAHELSHHWFGDLVTCQTAGDMWLNEGFAKYNQFLFSEKLYNEATYHSYVRSNHEEALHYVSVFEHGYWPIAHEPEKYTYGIVIGSCWETNTYEKGADVIYCLRNYMGDSAFFKGVQYYLATHMYQPVNADTLRNSLQRSSGMNLVDFFNGWVLNGGYPQFSIDSFTAVPSGPNYNVTVYVKQKLTGAPAYFNSVLLNLTFKSATWQTVSNTINVSGHLSNFAFTVPFKPVFAALNIDEKVSEAIAPDTLIVNTTGSHNMTNSRVYITVNSIPDSAFLYFEHNYTAPDPIKDTALHYRLSPNRYWKISGVLPAGFKATAQLDFDGRKVYCGGTGYLDTSLTMYTRDSLILLYRKNASQDWTEFPYYSFHPSGIKTNPSCYMLVDSLYMGEYTFANGVSHVIGINQIQANKGSLKVYPNPTSSDFTVSVPLSNNTQYLYIYSTDGKLMGQTRITAGQNDCVLSGINWRNGTYFISLWNGDKRIDTANLVVNH